ncbi:cysteine peptidase family C39 domain-containing protein [Solicola gregarius]|uniref:Peptidase C39-like domain-containing protein n=1 Tax=Solicola gregarius TaxID=2908642 RepID=A0AA46YJZ0_9ACTN|nr:hypothetical protein [Solicola gregarius]UYM04079.1 hypothetical protein L0C25_16215 [Solicola gregarius]
MNMRFSVSAAAVALLSATVLSAPVSAADQETPSDPSDNWPPTNARTSSPGSVPPTTITPAMQREIDRVVAAGSSGARLAPSASARALASAKIRCATFESQRYCLNYGWTTRTAAELRRDLVSRESTAMRTGGRQTGDADLLDSLRAGARMAPQAQAAADRAELRRAAAATSKVVELRHELEGTAYPAGYFARHPEARAATTERKLTYPKRYYVLNWHHVREQRRSYWCGPTTMQLIAWGWHGKGSVRPQSLWARRLGTTTSGSGIWNMVAAVNKYTGFDKKKYAGKYIVLDISGYGYKKWLSLNKRHYAKYRAPIVMHPVLDARYFDYLHGYSGGGHFQVGRGYNNRGKNPATIGLFEPWNPRRFNSSAPYVARLQYHRAYMSYLANKAHPQQNIGV